MIRIVGVQRSPNPQQEFILLQNQGGLRINLKGHLLLADSAMEGAPLDSTAHLFTEAEFVPAGMFILLTSGVGEPKWTKTKEQQLVYYSFMNRTSSVWERLPGAIHLLNLQFTHQERRPALLLR